MSIAVCPGSFDPPTLGHLDIIHRAAQLCDQVIVCVAYNPHKQGLLTVEERVELLESECAKFSNVSVDSFSGLLVEYCQKVGANVLIKGVRSHEDYGYELTMAHANRALSGIDTVFLPTAPAYSFISSSLVKEAFSFGGDIQSFVPPDVYKKLLDHQDK